MFGVANATMQNNNINNNNSLYVAYHFSSPNQSELAVLIILEADNFRYHLKLNAPVIDRQIKKPIT